MARTVPVNSGYSIINGSLTSGSKAVDVWLEWKQLSKDSDNNTSQVRVLLYAACTESSSTSWTAAEKFGYVGYDGGNKQYRSTTYNFANKAVNCFGDYTFTISHDADGTKTVTLEGSFTTKSSYIKAGTASGKITLDTIPRSSSITSAGSVVLGNTCSVRWTPNSSAFRYKLKFALGNWSYTTGAIHPNKTSAYTYTGYTIPLEVARQITAGSEGTMTVTLTTYSDSGCTASIGSDSESFKVTVPQNEDTQPTVTMALTPAVTPLAGLYLQGQSKVQATLSATAKLGANIKSYSMTAEGSSYGSPYLSGYLTYVGELEITGCAVDSREIPGYAKQTITVLPYYIPRLTGVAAYRCTADGVAADNGEYLKIEATRDYAPVVADGVQKNFCSIQYRYKAEKAEGYSEPVTILETDAEGNSVVTEPLLNATFSADTAYTVQIIAVDTVGRSSIVTVSIPSERVFRHKRPGGKGLGLGGFCEEDDLLDVHWNQRIRKDLRVDGSISDVYIRMVYLDGGKTITVQTDFSQFYSTQTGRQSIWLFGSANGVPIHGLLIVHGDGGSIWSGTGDVSTATGEAGKVTITLPNTAWDQFILMSAKKFSFG